jgi:hypothetical protein
VKSNHEPSPDSQAPTTKRKGSKSKLHLRAGAKQFATDLHSEKPSLAYDSHDTVVIRPPIKRINNHYIPVRKDFAGNLRNNGRAVIDLFERKLAQR